MAEAKKYRPVPGQTTFWGTKTWMWMADDHLLVASGFVFKQRHHRFNYGDIQALAMTRTPGGRFFNLLIGLGVLVFGSVMVLAYMDSGDVYVGLFSGLFLAPFLVVLLLNVMKGPTCKCALRTAVHEQPLHSLGFEWGARKAFDALRPRIEQAQAPLTAEERMAAERIERPASPTEEAGTDQAEPGGEAADGGGTAGLTVRDLRARIAPVRAQAVLPAPVLEDRGTIHLLLFGILLLDIPYSLASLLAGEYVPMPLRVFVGAVWLLAGVAAVMAALVRIQVPPGSQVPAAPSPVRALTIASAVYIILTVVLYYVFDFSSAMMFTVIGGETAMGAGLPREVQQWWHGISVLVDALLGLTGLLAWRDWRRTLTRPPATPDTLAGSQDSTPPDASQTGEG